MTPNHSTYRDNRNIGRPRNDSGSSDGGAGWRPRLGAAITLFGSEVTLGPEHVLGLVTIGVKLGRASTICMSSSFFFGGGSAHARRFLPLALPLGSAPAAPGFWSPAPERGWAVREGAEFAPHV